LRYFKCCLKISRIYSIKNKEYHFNKKVLLSLLTNLIILSKPNNPEDIKFVNNEINIEFVTKKFYTFFSFIKKEKISLLTSLTQRYPTKIYLYISNNLILFEDNLNV
jgi:hypothetical protein